MPNDWSAFAPVLPAVPARRGGLGLAMPNLDNQGEDDPWSQFAPPPAFDDQVHGGMDWAMPPRQQPQQFQQAEPAYPEIVPEPLNQNFATLDVFGRTSLDWQRKDMLNRGYTPQQIEQTVGPKSENPIADQNLSVIEHAQNVLRSNAEGRTFVPWLQYLTDRAVPGYSSAKQLTEAGIVKLATDKLDSEPLTQEEALILGQYLNEQEDAQERANAPGWSGTFRRAGDIVANLPAFAGELAATGGAGTAVKKSVQSLATRMLGRKAAARAVSSGVGNVAKVATQTYLMPQRVAKTAIERQTNWPGSQPKEPESWGRSFAHGAFQQSVEVGTELLGGKILRALLGKPLKSVAAALARKTPTLDALRKKIADSWILKKPGRSVQDFFRKAADKAGWDGILEEIGEERLNELILGTAGELGAKGDEYDFGTTGELAKGNIGKAWEKFLPELIAFGAIGGGIAFSQRLKPVADFIESPTRRKWEKLPPQMREAYPLDPKSSEKERRDLADKMRRDAESLASAAEAQAQEPQVPEQAPESQTPPQDYPQIEPSEPIDQPPTNEVPLTQEGGDPNAVQQEEMQGNGPEGVLAPPPANVGEGVESTPASPGEFTLDEIMGMMPQQAPAEPPAPAPAPIPEASAELAPETVPPATIEQPAASLPTGPTEGGEIAPPGSETTPPPPVSAPSPSSTAVAPQGEQSVPSQAGEKAATPPWQLSPKQYAKSRVGKKVAKTPGLTRAQSIEADHRAEVQQAFKQGENVPWPALEPYVDDLIREDREGNEPKLQARVAEDVAAGREVPLLMLKRFGGEKAEETNRSMPQIENPAANEVVEAANVLGVDTSQVVPVYRGTDDAGASGLKITEGGAKGDGVYFYTARKPAESHVTGNGRVIIGYVSRNDPDVEFSDEHQHVIGPGMTTPAGYRTVVVRNLDRVYVPETKGAPNVENQAAERPTPVSNPAVSPVGEGTGEPTLSDAEKSQVPALEMNIARAERVAEKHAGTPHGEALAAAIADVKQRLGALRQIGLPGMERDAAEAEGKESLALDNVANRNALTAIGGAEFADAHQTALRRLPAKVLNKLEFGNEVTDEDIREMLRQDTPEYQEGENEQYDEWLSELMGDVVAQAKKTPLQRVEAPTGSRGQMEAWQVGDFVKNMDEYGQIVELETDYIDGTLKVWPKVLYEGDKKPVSENFDDLSHVDMEERDFNKRLDRREELESNWSDLSPQDITKEAVDGELIERLKTVFSASDFEKSGITGKSGIDAIDAAFDFINENPKLKRASADSEIGSLGEWYRGEIENVEAREAKQEAAPVEQKDQGATERATALDVARKAVEDLPFNLETAKAQMDRRGYSEHGGHKFKVVPYPGTAGKDIQYAVEHYQEKSDGSHRSMLPEKYDSLGRAQHAAINLLADQVGKQDSAAKTPTETSSIPKYERTGPASDSPEIEAAKAKREQYRTEEMDAYDWVKKLSKEKDGLKRNATKKRRELDAAIQHHGERQRKAQISGTVQQRIIDKARIEDILSSPKTYDHYLKAMSELYDLNVYSALDDKNEAQTRAFQRRNERDEAVAFHQDRQNKWQNESDRYAVELIDRAKALAKNDGTLNKDETQSVAEEAYRGFSYLTPSLQEAVDRAIKRVKEARKGGRDGEIERLYNLGKDRQDAYKAELAAAEQGGKDWWEKSESIVERAKKENSGKEEERKAEAERVLAETRAAAEKAKAEIQAANRVRAKEFAAEKRVWKRLAERTKAAKWEKSSYTVKEGEKDKETTSKVQGEVFGPFGVREVIERDEGGVAKEKSYTVTHLGTGLPISSYKSKANAKSLAVWMSESGVNWESPEIAESGKITGEDGTKAKRWIRAFDDNDLGQLNPDEKSAVLAVAGPKESDVEADLILDSSDLGLGSKNEAPFAKKVREMANAVPEFAYNPVFTVDGKKGNSLVFKDGMTFRFVADFFGLDPMDLTDGQTVGINLEDLGIKRLSQPEMVAAVFKEKGFEVSKVDPSSDSMTVKWKPSPYEGKKIEMRLLSGDGKWYLQNGSASRGTQAATLAQQTLDGIRWAQPGQVAKGQEPSAAESTTEQAVEPIAPTRPADTQAAIDDFQSAAKAIHKKWTDPNKLNDFTEIAKDIGQLTYLATRAKLYQFRDYIAELAKHIDPALLRKYAKDIESMWSNMANSEKGKSLGLSKSEPVGEVLDAIEKTAEEPAEPAEPVAPAAEPELFGESPTPIPEPTEAERAKPQAFRGPRNVQFDVTGTPAGVNDPVSPGEIERRLSDLFKVPIRTGKVTGALGIYKPDVNVIRRIKSTYGLLGVTLHEVAHNIDAMHKLLFVGASPAALKELQKLDYDQTKQRVFEGFAEFLRKRMTHDATDPRSAERLAPEFTKHFDSFLAKTPVLAKKIDETKRLVDRYRMMSPQQRIEKQIREDREPERPADESVIEQFKSKVNDAWTKAVIDWKNPGHLIDLFDRAVEQVGYKWRNDESKAHEIFDAMSNTGSQHAFRAIENGVHPIGSTRSAKFGKGLWDAFEKAKLTTEEGVEWTNFFIAQHVNELASINPDYNPGMRSDDAQRILMDVSRDSAKQARFKELSKATRDFNDDLIRMLGEAGVLTQGEVSAILDAYKFYSPLERIADEKAFGRSLRVLGLGGWLDVFKPVKGRSGTGSGLPIVHPILSTTLRAMRFYDAAIKQQVKEQMARQIDPAIGGVKGMGWLMERVPGDPKLTQVQTEEAWRQIKRQLTAQGIDVSSVDEKQFPQMLNFWSVVAKADPTNFIDRILVNGNPVLYRMDAMLHYSLGQMSAPQLAAWQVLWRNFLTRPIKAGAVSLSTAFGGGNILNDWIQYQFTAQSKRGPASLTDPFKNLARYAKTKLLGNNDEMVKLYDEWVGQINSRFGDGVRTPVDIKNKLMAAGSEDPLLSKLIHPMQTASSFLTKVEDAIAMTEVGPRMSEFEASLAKNGFIRQGNQIINSATGKPQRPDRKSLLEATKAATETMPFKRRGQKAIAVGTMIPFFEAWMTGIGKYISTHRAAYRGEGNARQRVIVANLLMAAATMAYWMMRKDDDDYLEQEQWLNKFFTWKGVRIPRGREWGATSMLVEGMLNSLTRKESHALTEQMAEAMGQFAPPMSPSGMPLAEAFFNYDLWRGKSIESQGTERLLPQDRVKPWTRPLARWIGSYTGHAGLSPLKVEFLLDRMTGGAAKRLQDSARDVVTGDIKPSTIPFLGGVTLKHEYARTPDELYEQSRHESQVTASAKQNGKLDQAQYNKSYQLKEGADLLTEIRKVSSKAENDEAKDLMEKAAIGVARRFTGKSPLASYPDPFTGSVPSELKPIIDKWRHQLVINATEQLSKEDREPERHIKNGKVIYRFKKSDDDASILAARSLLRSIEPNYGKAVALFNRSYFLKYGTVSTKAAEANRQRLRVIYGR